MPNVNVRPDSQIDLFATEPPRKRVLVHGWHVIARADHRFSGDEFELAYNGGLVREGKWYGVKDGKVECCNYGFHVARYLCGALVNVTPLCAKQYAITWCGLHGELDRGGSTPLLMKWAGRRRRIEQVLDLTEHLLDMIDFALGRATHHGSTYGLAFFDKVTPIVFDAIRKRSRDIPDFTGIAGDYGLVSRASLLGLRNGYFEGNVVGVCNMLLRSIYSDSINLPDPYGIACGVVFEEMTHFLEGRARGEVLL